VVQTYTICAKDHATKQCPSLLGLKVVFKEAEEEIEPVYLMAQRRKWQDRKHRYAIRSFFFLFWAV
jgi:hypothetical protein